MAQVKDLGRLDMESQCWSSFTNSPSPRAVTVEAVLETSADEVLPTRSSINLDSLEFNRYNSQENHFKGCC